ncbi:uncharacterized protein LOC141700232 [Apium graveolens]|uniref:uncharacterized protein LOC141700232 n=1 Tax=Apium graveolens TaxID=4045 RepID=UPI003D79190A
MHETMPCSEVDAPSCMDAPSRARMEVEDPRDFDFDLDPRIPMFAEKTWPAEDTISVPIDKDDSSKILKVRSQRATKASPGELRKGDSIEGGAYPLRQDLHKPESSGRMLKWAVELGQFDLEYMPRTAIKGQTLADFLLEFDSEVDDKALVALHPSHPEVLEEFPHPWWILHVDGAVNNGGIGAGKVLVPLEGHHLMSAIHFKFYATNNDAEYEALINGLKISLEMGVRNLIAKSDSELVVNQVNRGFQARGPRIELYLRCTQRLILKFKEVRLECVPREKNNNADALAKMGSQQEAVLLGSIPSELQEIPSIPEVEVMQVDDAPKEIWMTPILAYIHKGVLLEDGFKTRRLRYQATRYVVYDEVLYKRGFNQPLLRCVNEEGNYILREVHEGICGNHSGVTRWR